jgi:hypothetical protein
MPDESVATAPPRPSCVQMSDSKHLGYVALDVPALGPLSKPRSGGVAGFRGLLDSAAANGNSMRRADDALRPVDFSDGKHTFADRAFESRRRDSSVFAQRTMLAGQPAIRDLVRKPNRWAVIPDDLIALWMRFADPDGLLSHAQSWYDVSLRPVLWSRALLLPYHTVAGRELTDLFARERALKQLSRCCAQVRVEFERAEVAAAVRVQSAAASDAKAVAVVPVPVPSVREAVLSTRRAAYRALATRRADRESDAKRQFHTFISELDEQTTFTIGAAVLILVALLIGLSLLSVRYRGPGQPQPDQWDVVTASIPFAIGGLILCVWSVVVAHRTNTADHDCGCCQMPCQSVPFQVLTTRALTPSGDLSPDKPRHVLEPVESQAREQRRETEREGRQEHVYAGRHEYSEFSNWRKRSAASPVSTRSHSGPQRRQHRARQHCAKRTK